MKQRLQNPFFLLAITGLIYQGLEQAGIKLEETTFKAIVDVISYVVIGTGVYSTFTPTDNGGTQ